MIDIDRPRAQHPVLEPQQRIEARIDVAPLERHGVRHSGRKLSRPLPRHGRLAAARHHEERALVDLLVPRLQRERERGMPGVVLRERHLRGALDARDAALQVDPPRRAENVQMADARIDTETLARGVPEPEIPLPWRPLLDRDEGGHVSGPLVDVLRADLDRLEQAERADTLLCLLDRAPPEQIARRVRQPPADDAIVHAPVSGDVDGAEETDRAGFGANDDARPCRIDRLARDADLRVRIAVVLKDLYCTLARGFFHLFGERRRRRAAADRPQVPRARPRGSDVEAVEPYFFDE